MNANLWLQHTIQAMGTRVRSLFVMLFCLVSFFAYSQSMSIASFKMDEADQTANVNPTMRIDTNNGEKCALIKIVTTQKNFSFDVGVLGISDIEWQNSTHPGEIWLYVPNGVMKISIQHPQFGSIKDYDLGGRLKKGRTYVMELTSDQVNTLVVDYDNSQILDVDITPHDADLYINGVKHTLDSNGHTSVQLSFGTHNYRIVANNYHPEESQIIINDKINRHQLSVRLKQAFGYLTVNSTTESNGSEVYLDDIHIGEIPITNIPITSGNHQLSVYQKLYLPYSEKINVTDSSSVNITPILKPNYSDYEIFVDGDRNAQIYDNGELIGTGHWKGKLEAGQHTLEAKKMNHTPTIRKIVVDNGIQRKMSLSRPEPIVGTLDIKTSPNDATVYIDNIKVGHTPYRNNRTIIGNHQVRIEKAGYKEVIENIQICKDQTTFIEKGLIDFYSAYICSTPSMADLYIDGIKKGTTPYYLSVPSGKYQVRLKKEGYQTYSKNYNLNGENNDINVKLRKVLLKNKTLYVQADYGFNGYNALGLGVGAYLANINIEGNCLIGLSYSEQIHWWDESGKREPFDARYIPNSWNVKVGYGIKLNYMLRLTPQIGAQMLILKEQSKSIIKESSNDFVGVKNANSMSFNLGTRLEAMLTPHIGICVSPSYNLPFIKSNGLKLLSDHSATIQKYNKGFGLLVGIQYSL